MRAMILAAGLGTRLRPLTEWRPKPAVPVRGTPLIGYQLALLAQHGVREVVVNAHHLPGILQEAAERSCPPGIELQFSFEPELLDTGGAIRKVAAFLRESDPCLLLAGDMLLDADLGSLLQQHCARGDSITLLLKRDPRADRFGTLGVDAEGRVRRIANRLDLGGEQRAGLWTWANVVAARAFEEMPDREAFVFLDDWVGRMIRSGADDVRAEIASGSDVLWEPVGTLEEYLDVNLAKRSFSYLDVEARARADGTHLGPDLVVGAGARLGAGVRLERAVVWDGERVPDGFQGANGVFAGGGFHAAGRGTKR